MLTGADRARENERRGFSGDARGPFRLRTRGVEDAAAHRAGVREFERGHRRGHLQPAAVHGAPPHREDLRIDRSHVLHPVAVGEHHRLQGHGDAAVPGAVLSRPQGSADGGLGGGVPPALLHQHAAAVAPRASVSVSRAQRRDQHGAGQSFVGGGARPPVSLSAAARFGRRPAGGVADRLGFIVARQHARTAARGRARSHARDAHAGAAGVAVGRHDRSRS